MSLPVATWLVHLLTAYLAVGALFGVALVAFGLARIDPAARGASLGLRLLLLPGSAALWPLLAGRWWRGAPPPTERTAHRRSGSAPS